MTYTRFASCIAMLTLGCGQAPSVAPPRASETASATEQSPPDPAAQLRAWVPTSAAPGAPPRGTVPPLPAPSIAATSHGETLGTVRETMDAGGYTYLRIAVEGVDRWVATTVIPVAVGDQVVVVGGDVMTNFHSRTLNRTFEQITFAGEVRGARGASASPPSATGGALPPGHPPVGLGRLPLGHPNIEVPSRASGVSH